MKDFKSLELMETFLKWQKNDLSSSEQRRLQEWLAAASDNHKEWERIRSIWQNATPPLIPEGAPLKLQWEALDKRIQETGAKKSRTRTPLQSPLEWNQSVWKVGGFGNLFL